MSLQCDKQKSTDPVVQLKHCPNSDRHSKQKKLNRLRHHGTGSSTTDSRRKALRATGQLMRQHTLPPRGVYTPQARMAGSTFYVCRHAYINTQVHASLRPYIHAYMHANGCLLAYFSAGCLPKFSCAECATRIRSFAANSQISSQSPRCKRN